VLDVLFVPFVVGSLLPEHLSYTVEKASPMGIAALEPGAPIGPWAGIGVTAAWAIAGLAVALWLVARRDA
jgi:ABC-2 type transport system permease protein